MDKEKATYIKERSKHTDGPEESNESSLFLMIKMQ